MRGGSAVWAPSRTVIIVELSVAFFAVIFGVLLLRGAQDGWQRFAAFGFGLLGGFGLGAAVALSLFRRAVLVHMQSQHQGAEVPDRMRLGSRRASVRD